MLIRTNDTRLNARLIDGLYVEAMVLADEARGYFDETGRAERDRLAPLPRVTFACESLKVTTRLMHVIAWLLARRATEAAESTAADARVPWRRLGRATPTDPDDLDGLPQGARTLIAASCELYDRIDRLDGLDATLPTGDAQGPARTLIRRLERAF